MTWIWWLLGLALLAVVLLLTLPLTIPREPDREGIQDGEASLAYNRVSRWPVFAFGRYLVLKPLSMQHHHGLALDIGSGPGYLTAAISRKLAGHAVIGLDISREMVTIARDNWPRQHCPNLEFIEGQAEALPFADNSVGIAVSSLSLHHWAGPDAAIREIHRVLKPGARLIIFDLRRDCPRLVYYAFGIGQWLLTPKAIRRTNGAVGSLWASYTANELEALLATTPFRTARVKARPGWLLAEAQK